MSSGKIFRLRVQFTTALRFTAQGGLDSLFTFEQRAQHPRGLLVHLHTLGQQIRRWLVTDLVDHRENTACGTRDRLLPIDQLADHLISRRHTLLFLDR